MLGNSTQRRVNHPACARVLAMHRGGGGVLGPFTFAVAGEVDASGRRVLKVDMILKTDVLGGGGACSKMALPVAQTVQTGSAPH